MRWFAVCGVLALACNGGGDETSGCEGTDLDGSVLCTGWMVNEAGTLAPWIGDDDVIEDVERISVVDDGATYLRVQASGVPSYVHTVTADDIAHLDARPQGADDFQPGGYTVAVGDSVEFGQDIGYDSTGCTGDPGYGYWPPGPVCPIDVGFDVYFPAAPEPATETCWTGLDQIGLLVNGTALFNWWDAQSYESQDTWHYLAPEAETWDVGLCGGHGAMGTYHQHSSQPCLTEALGDDGSGHSPVYGFVADGYPFYGPWVAAGERAASCWATREYTAGSATGCGADGVRDCVLVDPQDPSAGTVAATAGPDTTDTITSLSGNPIEATSGLFFEDWYYDADCTDAGGLDAHNGHDHDGLGYHYHQTATFPFSAGPVLYGRLHDNALASCRTGPTEGGGPPG